LRLLADAFELEEAFDVAASRPEFLFKGFFVEVRGGSASVVTARKPTTTMPASSE